MRYTKSLAALGLAFGAASVLAMQNKKAAKIQKKNDEIVDTSIDDSFPASDPPSWNAGHAIGSPNKVA
jgi:hypothetical protein